MLLLDKRFFFHDKFPQTALASGQGLPFANAQKILQKKKTVHFALARYMLAWGAEQLDASRRLGLDTDCDLIMLKLQLSDSMFLGHLNMYLLRQFTRIYTLSFFFPPIFLSPAPRGPWPSRHLVLYILGAIKLKAVGQKGMNKKNNA